MRIPEWLKDRPTQINISSIIYNFSRRFNIQSFSKISGDNLSQYLREIPKLDFFKLLRVLGVYGVYFYKRLSSYSSIAEDYPDVMTIPEKYWSYHLTTFMDNPNLIRIMDSCGLKYLGCLHGIPRDNYLRMIKGNINNEKLALFNPIETTKICDNFFSYNVNQQNSIKSNNLEEGKNFSNDLQYKSVQQYDFSYRVQNCLKKSNIKTIGELQALSESELLSIPNLGKRSVVEIHEKLKKIINRPEKFKNTNQYVRDLGFSNRVQNCLKKSNIKTINELLTLTEDDLLSIPNMGRSSVAEIKNKLLKIGVNLPFAVKKPLETNEIDLSDDKIGFILRTRIDEFLIEEKHIQKLKKENIEYVWQLVKLTTNELKKIRGVGKKFISDIENILYESSLSFGLHFNHDTLFKLKQENDSQKIEHEEIPINWFKNTASKFAFNTYDFLDGREKKVTLERISIEKNKRETLENLGSYFNISRERVRQIEKKAKNKIIRNINGNVKIVLKAFENKLSQLGWIANFKNIEPSLCELSELEKGIIDSIILDKKKNILFDWQFSLVSRVDKVFVDDIFLKIEKAIFESNKHKFYFSEQDLFQATKKIITQHSIFEGQSLENFIAKFFFEKHIISDNSLFFFKKNLRQNKLIQQFKELYPNGVHLYQKQNIIFHEIQKIDPELFDFPNPRAMVARIVDHENVFLWDRGFFVHRDHLQINDKLVNKIESWIIDYFDRGCHRFQVRVPYTRFQEELIVSNIPTLYSLYTLLRIQGNDRIGLFRFPTIVDMEKVNNPEKGKLEELESYFENAGKDIPYKKVADEFIEKRGWNFDSLQQTINVHSDLIYPWKDNSYIHLDHLRVNYARLEELIDKIRKKLHTINAPYNLKGARNEMPLLWEQACPSAEIRTIIKLIRQAGPEDLVIERNFIRFIDSPPESTSTVISLEEYVLDKNEEVSRFEIKEEFIKNRGWTDMQLYDAIRNANLFQSGESSFVHPAVINWSDKLSQTVYSILSEYLRRRNNENQPYMQIGVLIYEFVLPELPNNIQWTSELLKSVGNEFQDFIFFDDAYIFSDNSFDIEDLDDMIAYLLTNNFEFGIASIKEVEKILYREGILSSGYKIPINQFFEGSSIRLLEASGEIGLSEVGKKKYGRK